MPGRSPAAQYRTASAPYSPMIAIGSSGELPADFESFLRSGSWTKPEINASDHGDVPNS